MNTKTCIVDDEVMMIVGGREKGKGRRSIMEVLDGKCLVGRVLSRLNNECESGGFAV